jgi:hypothetical protein
MRKALIFSCIIGSLAIILGQFGFYEAILMLFLAGIIPGTQYSISASSMFYLLIVAMATVIVWLSRGFIIDIIHTTFKTQEPRKKQLPRRRFSRI